MAQGFASEVIGVLDGTLNPPAKLDGRVQGGRVRIREATLDLSLATTAKNAATPTCCAASRRARSSCSEF
jgi:hypothetical protein